MSLRNLRQESLRRMAPGFNKRDRSPNFMPKHWDEYKDLRKKTEAVNDEFESL